MGGTSLQADQFLDRLVGLSHCPRFQVLPQEDQGDNQCGSIIKSYSSKNTRKERRYHTHDVGRGRANGDQCIHIGAAMTQRFKGSAMKLPADDCPDRRCERKQEIVLAWEGIHEEHVEDYNR